MFGRPGQSSAAVVSPAEGIVTSVYPQKPRSRVLIRSAQPPTLSAPRHYGSTTHDVRRMNARSHTLETIRFPAGERVSEAGSLVASTCVVEYLPELAMESALTWRRSWGVGRLPEGMWPFSCQLRRRPHRSLWGRAVNAPPMHPTSSSADGLRHYW